MAMIRRCAAQSLKALTAFPQCSKIARPGCGVLSGRVAQTLNILLKPAEIGIHNRIGPKRWQDSCLQAQRLERLVMFE